MYPKSIIELTGIQRQIQNLVNSIILAITCLGARNIILILNTKTEIILEDLRAKVNHEKLFNDWVGTHNELAIAAFVMVAAMLFLMAILARHSFSNQDLSQEKAAALRGLERGTWQRGVWFLAFVLTWTPLLFDQRLPLIPPAVLVLIYIFGDQIIHPLLQNGIQQD